MSHQETYRHNEAYAEFLANESPHFHTKYADSLCVNRPGARILDVGCGVGQVVGSLARRGYEGYGVDVSEPNIARAQKASHRCQMYDGKHLPFADAHFAAAGAINVLEHVTNRKPLCANWSGLWRSAGGHSFQPEFVRVIGYHDYRPKCAAWRTSFEIAQRLAKNAGRWKPMPKAVRFDRMTPIVKEPFTADDGAIVTTRSAGN